MGRQAAAEATQKTKLELRASRCTGVVFPGPRIIDSPGRKHSRRVPRALDLELAGKTRGASLGVCSAVLTHSPCVGCSVPKHGGYTANEGGERRLEDPWYE